MIRRAVAQAAAIPLALINARLRRAVVFDDGVSMLNPKPPVAGSPPAADHRVTTRSDRLAIALCLAMSAVTLALVTWLVITTATTH